MDKPPYISWRVILALAFIPSLVFGIGYVQFLNPFGRPFPWGPILLYNLGWVLFVIVACLTVNAAVRFFVRGEEKLSRKQQSVVVFGYMLLAGLFLVPTIPFILVRITALSDRITWVIGIGFGVSITVFGAVSAVAVYYRFENETLRDLYRRLRKGNREHPSG